MGEGNNLQAKTLTWDSLPEELRVEILARVPVKSLFQLRSVCQTWNSLITSPNFITAHLKQSKNQPLLLLRYGFFPGIPMYAEEIRYSLRFDNGSLPHFPCPNLEPAHHGYSRGKPLRIVGSCNGVVCLIDCTGYAIHKLILWNPSIRKCLVLPDGGVLPCGQSNNLQYYLFPEPNFLCLAVGFGFDSRSNDFKVVTIAGLLKNIVDVGGRKCVRAPAKVGVFSYNARSWKGFGVDLGTLLLLSGSRKLLLLSGLYGSLNQFVFNGRVHWLVGRRVDGEDRILLCGSIWEMRLPESVAGCRWAKEMSILLYGGRFAVFVYGCPHCELWVMEEYGVEKSWIKRFDFKLEGYGVAGFRSNGKILLVSDYTRLLSFDPRTHTITEIETHEGRCHYYYAVPHVESLFMMDGTKTTYRTGRGKRGLRMSSQEWESQELAVTNQEMLHYWDDAVTKNYKNNVNVARVFLRIMCMVLYS